LNFFVVREVLRTLGAVGKGDMATELWGKEIWQQSCEEMRYGNRAVGKGDMATELWGKEIWQQSAMAKLDGFVRSCSYRVDVIG
jgi:hypothetical protein